jgi:hypothetical protein
MYKIVWEESGIEIVCSCGNTGLIIMDESEVCDDCGRKYTLISNLEVQEPCGRCQLPTCNNWIYSSQPKVMYCSAVCSMIRARARLLEKRALNV